MNDDLDEHISQIATRWTLVRRALAPSDPDGAAMEELFVRYRGAVWRFLASLVRNQDAADELFQEFATRLLGPGFRNVDATRGRFRDYLKRCLRNLAHDHYRRARLPTAADPQAVLDLQAVADTIAQHERDFETHCREELMRQAWEALDQDDARAGRHFAALLRQRITAPELSSAQLAEAMAQQTGQAWTAASVDKTVHRARKRFADLLLDGVAHTLRAPGRTEMEEELADLGLLTFCADALARRYADGA